MFQTEINHYIQSWGNEYFTLLMQWASGSGVPRWMLLGFVLLPIVFNYKKGLLLIGIVFISLLITDFFKHYFALPRPFHVDCTLSKLDENIHDRHLSDFQCMGAPGFFEFLPDEAVQFYRQKTPRIPFGFPSGHTSISVVFWGSLALLFRKRWLTFIAIIGMVVIPFSRLYLGVHFLADVLGGYVLGFALLGLVYLLLLRSSKLQKWKLLNE